MLRWTDYSTSKVASAETLRAHSNASPSVLRVESLELNEQALEGSPLGQEGSTADACVVEQLAHDDDGDRDSRDFVPIARETVGIDDGDAHPTPLDQLAEMDQRTCTDDLDVMPSQEEARDAYEVRVARCHEDLDRPKPLDAPHFHLLLESLVGGRQPTRPATHASPHEGRAGAILSEREAER
jgi:hypothetical protein